MCRSLCIPNTFDDIKYSNKCRNYKPNITSLIERQDSESSLEYPTENLCLNQQYGFKAKSEKVAPFKFQIEGTAGQRKLYVEALESVSAQVVFKSNHPSESVLASCCKQKLRDGQFSAAIKVLQSSGVHSASSEVMEKLLAKHPQNEVPLCHPNLIGSHSHFSVDQVKAALMTFAKGTAPGRDGLRATHLIDMLHSAAGGVGPRLLDALTTVCDLLFGGLAPPSIAPYIASAGLTPLKKPDNDVRPIAVGMILRRLVSKLGMARVKLPMSQYLQSVHQYGVAISGGVEAVLHAFNRIVAERAELLECLLY
ncbi:hypothetical protein BCR33DRAFT_771459 [Rhizoclosmatium globosum]|uniref:Uncharacterized protein n=1 Tax=Rhizoclosmatium globosum TaxID=329046 RepID=A0A1Y2BDB1_9FUNG|nr:hypothetical protein BCR33DRAFT_771459 [Rhizoclosmatium globosum]|eukprot:ORY32477.1 hypothetical protein BCR33DRAFT_771459 [Rhizoclosmatium globosum]